MITPPYNFKQVLQRSFESLMNRIRVVVVNQDSEPVVVTDKDLLIKNMVSLVVSGGFVDGESYDQICFTDQGAHTGTFTFMRNNLNLFQVVVDITDNNNYKLEKRGVEFPMLQENGDFLLLENGDKILAQGIVP